MHIDYLKDLTLLLFILLTLFALVLIAFNSFRKRKKNRNSDKDKGYSEVGFVVDTFHDVVLKLKEKEKELERLRSFAEQRAVSIEAYNENVLQSVPSGVISIDNELKIKSVNQAAEQILGISAKDIIERLFTATLEEPFITLASENMIVSRTEYPYITHDGRHIWLGITTSELRNTEGEKLGYIFVFTDLTDIKALQVQVELKERLSQLGEMSAGISHELRNSMSVISGYAKLLAKKADENSRPTVDAITEEIRNMDMIISELLSFAKPSVLNMEQANLCELIKDAAAAVFSGNEKIRVSINTGPEVAVRADAVLLRQALSNLFINAVDAMPEGGALDISLRYIQNRAEISIRDTGCGIPDDIKNKIFLPFYSTKPQGIGFGLALVQKIIVSHGGSIEVASKEGEGTQFTIILPGEH
ncbi:MAG: PAS domain S-box protein [Nitrospiraceae bacterium]|nr:MAG: PAS domain S-box protein [Nitrospiraceae bacterium]